MDLQSIKEYTLEHGGYTNSINGRYSVAIEGFEVIVPVEQFTTNFLAEYVKEVGKEFGTWVNDGNVYLDKVECFNDLSEALKQAEKRNELAIFDLKELKEIEV